MRLSRQSRPVLATMSVDLCGVTLVVEPTHRLSLLLRFRTCLGLRKTFYVAGPAGFEPAHRLINSELHYHFATGQNLVDRTGFEPVAS